MGARGDAFTTDVLFRLGTLPDFAHLGTVPCWTGLCCHKRARIVSDKSRCEASDKELTGGLTTETCDTAHAPCW